MNTYAWYTFNNENALPLAVAISYESTITSFFGSLAYPILIAFFIHLINCFFDMLSYEYQSACSINNVGLADINITLLDQVVVLMDTPFEYLTNIINL